MTQQTTHHPLAESISALMDNEASELELQRILKASESDSDLKATWSRYQVASAALHRDLPLIEMSDFAARVSAALEHEENHSSAPLAVESDKKTPWWQNVARFAVAASVAGGVVLFAQNYGSVGQDAPAAVAATNQVQTPVNATPAPSLPAGYHAQPLTARTVGLQTGYESRQQDNRQVVFVPLPSSSKTSAQVSNEEVRDYLNQLIEEHADNAALNSGQGMLPFARVVLTEED
jgi:sigma-E factor negative regulatory protein RseA